MTVPPTRHTGHETGSKHHLVCGGISCHTRVVLGMTCFVCIGAFLSAVDCFANISSIESFFSLTFVYGAGGWQDGVTAVCVWIVDQKV
jgi:hypothetical protein